MKTRKLINLTLFLWLSLFPPFVCSQTKVMTGGGFTFSNIEDYSDGNSSLRNRIAPKPDYRYPTPNISFSLEQYLNGFFFVSISGTYKVNEIPYLGSSRNSRINSMRFNQLSNNLLLNFQTVKSPKDRNAIRNLSLGIGINVDYLNNFKLGNKDEGNFNKVVDSRNQMNKGLIYQAAFTYQNFKIIFQNSLGFENPQKQFKEIKSLDWFSFLFGYHFVLSD